MNKDLWNEGKWIDMWSLVHLLSGISLGSILYELNFSPTLSFAVTSGIFIGWELLEYLWKWEKLTNHLSDFIVNYLGYGIFYVVYYVFERPFSMPVFIAFNALFVGLNAWGFASYKKRKKTQERP